MQLVRLKLRHDCPFFFLGPIRLTSNDPISDPIDFDDIPSKTREVIVNAASRSRDITIVNEENGQALVVVKGQEKVNLDDVEDLETVTLVPEPKKMTYTKEHENSAEILLDKNGNGIRALMKSMQASKENMRTLLAAKDLEEKGKNRTGVLATLKEVLENMEYQLNG